MSGSTFRTSAAAAVLATMALLWTTATAQPPAPYVPRQSDRPQPVEGDEPGFAPIFDGRSLDGWEGDSTYWRVEQGAILGEITPATIVKSNTFLIWRGGRPRDFELKLEYRISPQGNSGINYRSTSIPDPVTPGHRFALRGYQCDLDGRRQYTGNNYEEKGRLFLAVRGQMTRVVGGRPPVLLGSLGDTADLGPLLTDDWNAVHLTIRGNVLIHAINGRVMTVVTDDDVAHRPADGLIGVQVHVGPPMTVAFRNVRLRTW